MSSTVENTQTNTQSTQSNMEDWFDRPQAIKLKAIRTLITLLKKREKSITANKDKRLKDFYNTRFKPRFEHERIKYEEDKQLILDDYNKEITPYLRYHHSLLLVLVKLV